MAAIIIKSTHFKTLILIVVLTIPAHVYSMGSVPDTTYIKSTQKTKSTLSLAHFCVLLLISGTESMYILTHLLKLGLIKTTWPHNNFCVKICLSIHKHYLWPTICTCTLDCLVYYNFEHIHVYTAGTCYTAIIYSQFPTTLFVKHSIAVFVSSIYTLYI